MGVFNWICEDCRYDVNNRKECPAEEDDKEYEVGIACRHLGKCKKFIPKEGKEVLT